MCAGGQIPCASSNCECMSPSQCCSVRGLMVTTSVAGGRIAAVVTKNDQGEEGNTPHKADTQRRAGVYSNVKLCGTNKQAGG